LRERLESAEVKVRSKVAELAGIKEELSASRQDAQSSDRAMRDQLSQVEERLATTTRDLQLSQLPQPVAEPEEVGELRRQLSAERNRRERLLKESNERLRKAHEVMAKMRKTLERLGLVNQEEQSQSLAENQELEAPIKDAKPEENPAKLERPTLPKPSLNPPIGDPTLLPDVVESIELPKQTALAEEPEFSDDPPPVIDED
jgi:septum formation inhibitor MinC